jgi:hypothetical protein
MSDETGHEMARRMGVDLVFFRDLLEGALVRG